MVKAPATRSGSPVDVRLDLGVGDVAKCTCGGNRLGLAAGGHMSSNAPCTDPSRPRICCQRRSLGSSPACRAPHRRRRAQSHTQDQGPRYGLSAVAQPVGHRMCLEPASTSRAPAIRRIHSGLIHPADDNIASMPAAARVFSRAGLCEASTSAAGCGAPRGALLRHSCRAVGLDLGSAAHAWSRYPAQVVLPGNGLDPERVEPALARGPRNNPRIELEAVTGRAAWCDLCRSSGVQRRRKHGSGITRTVLLSAAILGALSGCSSFDAPTSGITPSPSGTANASGAAVVTPAPPIGDKALLTLADLAQPGWQPAPLGTKPPPWTFEKPGCAAYRAIDYPAQQHRIEARGSCSNAPRPACANGGALRNSWGTRSWPTRAGSSNNAAAMSTASRPARIPRDERHRGSRVRRRRVDAGEDGPDQRTGRD